MPKRSDFRGDRSFVNCRGNQNRGLWKPAKRHLGRFDRKPGE
jgi:hypothetical protein